MKHSMVALASMVLIAACGDASTEPNASVSGDVTAILTASEASPATIAQATRVETTQDYNCRGVVTGRFENVFVLAGQSCTLTNAIVSGNIRAEQRSRLAVYETTTRGNIEAVQALELQVRGGRIDGNIEAKEGVSGGQVGVRIFGGTMLTQGNITVEKNNTGIVSITDAVLASGNIEVKENTVGTSLELLRNRVGQNVEVSVNRGVGAKSVIGNTVTQTLTCKENRGPFTGAPNVAGEVDGQCRR